MSPLSGPTSREAAPACTWRTVKAGGLVSKAVILAAIGLAVTLRVVKIIDTPPITIIDGNRVIGWMY